TNTAAAAISQIDIVASLANGIGQHSRILLYQLST
ncbi:unnamed protein product, partial [marine sediment metagenome]